MKVVILCGGQGTRLREETEYKPKPLVSIGGRPILWHIMKMFSHYGFNDFVLCLGYKAEVIKDYFLKFEELTNDFTLNLRSKEERVIHHKGAMLEDWNITFVDTGLNTQTGGRVSRVKSFLEKDAPFFLTYGDGIADIDIPKLLEFHKQEGRIGTVTGVRPPSRFGELLSEGNKVISFEEKPNTSEGHINGGFFVFDPKIFSYLSDDENCILERTPLEKLVSDGELSIRPHDKFWHCMDTYRDFLLLEELWKNGAPWKVWKD